MSTGDSVAKRAFAIIKARLETIATPIYRTDVVEVYEGQTSLHRLASADSTKFPALILSIGLWERTAETPRRNNTLTLQVDAVLNRTADYDQLIDLMADVEEVVEDVDDPYLNTPDGNLLRDAALVVAPVLDPPDTGGSLEVLSCGVELRFPTTVGDPTHVI